jgi:hypothetical protein
MELSSVFGGDSLKAADLQGHEPTVIIASVEMKKFDNGNKLVITFEGKKKSLVCNKTNANRIAYAFGSNTDNWIGKEITLFTDLVDFQGNTVEAIRVRAKKEPAQRPSARPSSADMAPPSDMNDEIGF